jgi:hypothetical protein
MIDKEELRSLASDPKQSAESISEGLGLGKVNNLYYQFGRNAELKNIYNEGRAAAKAQRHDSKTKRDASRKQKLSSSPPPPASRIPTAKAA